MNFHLGGMALAMVVLAVIVGTASQARGDLGGRKESAESVDEILNEPLARYYRKHANVRLGPERRLANGVAWRLLTDVRTGIVVPRITWMPDRKSMLTANALLEVMQGANILGYDRHDLGRRYQELRYWEGGGPPWVRKPPYIVQEKVAVTYATSRLVSYVDVTREIREISMGVYVYGIVLDLEQATVRSTEYCPDRDDTFRFGELLDACDEEVYERFVMLWADKVRRAIDKARARGDELSEQCGESMGDLEKKDRNLALYLTPAGLAVFNGYWIPNSAKYCAFHENLTVNPIILTYEELEPFMKPGPWRDDVLKQARPARR